MFSANKYVPGIPVFLKQLSFGAYVCGPVPSSNAHHNRSSHHFAFYFFVASLHAWLRWAESIFNLGLCLLDERGQMLVEHAIVCNMLTARLVVDFLAVRKRVFHYFICMHMRESLRWGSSTSHALTVPCRRSWVEYALLCKRDKSVEIKQLIKQDRQYRRMVMNKSPRCFYQFGKIIAGGGGPRTEKRVVKKIKIKSGWKRKEYSNNNNNQNNKRVEKEECQIAYYNLWSFYERIEAFFCRWMVMDFWDVEPKWKVEWGPKLPARPNPNLYHYSWGPDLDQIKGL